jgi:hypothetical protein
MIRFVGENYAALREHGAFAAGVPGELGGGDASIPELSASAPRARASTAARRRSRSPMHTHPIAAQAYMWRAGNKAPEPLLKRVATVGIVLATSGGSDWLNGSGKLEKVEGGFRSRAGRSSAAAGRAPICCSRRASTTIPRTDRR